MYYHPPNRANLRHQNQVLNEEASPSINSSSNGICGLEAFGVGGVDTQKKNAIINMNNNT
ncbi:hypothetical protein MKW98_022140 [Papaver atlanticum]|uniref:Uncharacterized protein n=1 Tax=Papaver atlanticum TaxID=357466 RepID=A0AAD4T141_9MAGN|nr:hypothetical protein MKW98_022140 [Papaver atlanticum]